MKSLKFTVGAVIAGVALVACGGENAALETQKDKVSYIIGQNIGQNFRQQGLDVELIDVDKLRLGMKDALAGLDSRLTDDEIETIMTAFQQQMMDRQDSRRVENKRKGEEFLAQNAREAGVTVLPSGLQYRVIEEGTGEIPGETSVVKVHYTGTLIDGTVFDSSVERGQPATFPVNGVIAGWTEALQLMPVGSKWKLFIPSDLAYGEHGAGGDIGPNATLIFDVELLSIEN